MKIKSLLLGSAAVMAAVSGAQAADAIVVEPEPMEYVKVCDMYGAGFFYIPGTETCLKIGGYVRVQYTVSHDEDHESTVSDHDSYARAVLGFTAQNETEYGTLGSQITVRWQAGETTDVHDEFSTSETFDYTADLWVATINLAGFRAGFDADNGGAQNRYAGYGFYNANASGGYGFDTALFFEYGGNVGDWNYVVGIQESVYSGASGAPDPYVGISGSMGALSLGAVVIYDSNGFVSHDAGPFVEDHDGGVYYKIRADYDLSSFLPGGSIGAWWRADHGKTDYVHGHQWGVTMKANLTDKLVAFAGFSRYEGENDYADGVDVFDPADVDRWVAGVRWNVVSGLYVQAEYFKTITSSATTWNGTTAVFNDGDAAGGYTLRVHRSF